MLSDKVVNWEKDEKPFMRLLWLAVKIPTTLTDVGMGQLTTTMANDNLKQTDVYNSGTETHRSLIIHQDV